MEVKEEVEINTSRKDREKNLGKYSQKGHESPIKGKKLVDHTNTVCKLCSSKETHIKKSNGSLLWYKYKTDENGNFNIQGAKWDGTSRICHSCYSVEVQKLPNSQHNRTKAQRKFRNKQLSKDSESGKGYIGEQIWCKARGVKNCNIEMDNFTYPIDHSPDPDYGIVNTEISTFKEESTGWKGWSCHTEGEYEYIICFCMDKEWKEIERTYIIPAEEIGKL